MAGFRLEGNVSGSVAEVDSNNNLFTNTPGYRANGSTAGGGPNNMGGFALHAENDTGEKTGVREIYSGEIDKDYRLRVAHDNVLDQELFNYSLQNSGKHQLVSTTMAATISSAGILTNSGGITTVNTGLTFGTHAMFMVGGTQGTIAEASVAFSAQPNANSIFDFGLFQRGATTAFAPLDGVFFRVSSAGIQGVISSAGSEVTPGVFPLSQGTGTYVYTNNATNRYLIQINNVSCTFWINNFKYAEIPTPVSLNFPCKSVALPWSFRHAIVGGTAGAIMQAVVSDYRIFTRGENFDDSLANVNQRVLGSYQTLSGATPGHLIAGTVTTGTLVKPTAAVPLNASLAANLPNSLGGRIYETLTSGLAVNTDGIYMQYQVPAGTAAVPGRRLKIMGLSLSASIATAITGNPCTTEFMIAFGSLVTTLNIAESASMAAATTKMPRRVMCPNLTQRTIVTQAVETAVSQASTYQDFSASPIYINPGEFLSLVGNKTATSLPTAGVIAHTYQFVYSWE